MTVVSIDLAACRYEDIGVAVLSGAPNAIRVQLVTPAERGLRGAPDREVLRRFCCELASETGADLILLDGPQGWRGPTSPFEHMRACERCTRTPGKTGLPGAVKPASWTRMADFSVQVFDALDASGWRRFSDTWPVDRAAIETFPTHAWRTLGFEPLPAKRRRDVDLANAARLLGEWGGIRWPREPTHDELQAVVAGIGGLALRREGPDACDIHGYPPFREAGSWREGLILSPRSFPGRRLGPAAAASRSSGSRCYCGRCG